MASRIVVNTLRASARPRALPTVTRAVNARAMSSSNPPPSERASEIINNLPSSQNLVTKTGTVILGTGLLATAISQELYVLNEETVVAAGTFILLAFLAKLIREPYKEWADGHIQRIWGVLESSRAEHTQTVKDRINSVEQMKDVVSLTEGLFALSKETAKLESEAFVQQQKVALASEVKAVLDSWVRFEQQAKESEQTELAKSVIDKVLSSIKDEKTQKEILANAVAEVEQLVKNKAI
ncbi:ATP4, subunit B of the stator stalk of mitochondrial F1F0 ATP synthase [Serpula lacrymans var. lacrymans S7.3]|uniref:ATP synthase subunit 4 n=2 Tax=Serpula lacrymans var. lacrymans TaxID=341189 RepID=F8Q4L0_SERL3|nr:subunit B of the stator stalk of mitochondrial F1F0 ATP synthase, ATP4 [Serpula lacrymans var. lacrymans S7.9]EGN97065.1 ATP4, subunit B of the stator stalk of mitochondrial F1F0 ATP synthase [Serpula lacrymans var. lacrymans S7.3]EGO22668.1 subunit B of the stator stalk of mitochondrial F1F0 ATP synthase, ATP4 [Serpula lacrymans var. lacrymans S7.9]